MKSMWASTIGKAASGLGQAAAGFGKAALDGTRGGQLVNAAIGPGDMEAKGKAIGEALAGGRPSFSSPNPNQPVGFGVPAQPPSAPVSPLMPKPEMLAMNPMTSQEIMDKYLSY